MGRYKQPAIHELFVSAHLVLSWRAKRVSADALVAAHSLLRAQRSLREIGVKPPLPNLRSSPLTSFLRVRSSPLPS